MLFANDNDCQKEKRYMTQIINRRKFIKTSLLGTLGAGLSLKGASAFSSSQSSGDDIPKRVLGKTGEKITMIGMPGWHVARMKEEKNAIRMIRMALDMGINFFDSAWCYEGGKSDERLGKGLGNDRKKIFLMTKVHGRDKEESAKHLHDSLRKLKTDYLDLWQFHDLRSVEEAERIFQPGGAIETALKAKEEGKVRHIGFTGHMDPRIHLKVIQEHHDLMETVQMPINLVDQHYPDFSFINTVLPEALKHNLGVIAMKTCSIGILIEEKVATVEECLNFAWSLPVSTVVSGMDHFDHLKHNIGLAKKFTPMSTADRAKLLARTKITSGPAYERYKVGSEEWRVFPREPLL